MILRSDGPERFNTNDDSLMSQTPSPYFVTLTKFADSLPQAGSSPRPTTGGHLLALGSQCWTSVIGGTELSSSVMMRKRPSDVTS